MRYQPFMNTNALLGAMQQNIKDTAEARKAQWNAFGNALKEVGETALRQHHFNLAEKQREKDNAFRDKAQDLQERHFGFQKEQAQINNTFRENQANEQKRQFNLQFGEAQKNNALDREHKRALIDKYYYDMNQSAQNQEITNALLQKFQDNPDSLSLQEQAFLKNAGYDVNDDKNFTIAKSRQTHESVMNSNKLLRNAEELLAHSDIKGLMYGARKLINNATGGYVGLSEEQNQFTIELRNFLDGYIKEKYGNQTSQYKEQMANKLFDELFASPEQFNTRIKAMAQDAIKQQDEKIKTLAEMKVSPERLNDLNAKQEHFKQVFLMGAKERERENQKPTRYVPKALRNQNAESKGNSPNAQRKSYVTFKPREQTAQSTSKQPPIPPFILQNPMDRN